MTLQKKKIDLCEFVTRQILLYQPEIEKAGMNLDFFLPQENNIILCDIDEVQMERVFSNLIVRVDESRNSKTGGSGLGLTIVKNIVEAHGFTIQLINRNTKKMGNESDNCGCQFIITVAIETI